MARGRKKALTLDEQFAKVVSEIEETKNKLKELNSQKDELEEKIRMGRIAELDDFISSRGLSVDEVKEMLEKQWTQMINLQKAVALIIKLL